MPVTLFCDHTMEGDKENVWDGFNDAVSKTYTTSHQAPSTNEATTNNANGNGAAKYIENEDGVDPLEYSKQQPENQLRNEDLQRQLQVLKDKPSIEIQVAAFASENLITSYIQTESQATVFTSKNYGSQSSTTLKTLNATSRASSQRKPISPPRSPPRGSRSLTKREVKKFTHRRFASTRRTRSTREMQFRYLTIIGIKRFGWKQREVMESCLKAYNRFLREKHLKVVKGCLNKEEDLPSGAKFFNITVEVEENTLDDIIANNYKCRTTVLSDSYVVGGGLIPWRKRKK